MAEYDTDVAELQQGIPVGFPCIVVHHPTEIDHAPGRLNYGGFTDTGGVRLKLFYCSKRLYKSWLELRHFNPAVVFVDEAAKATELEVLNAIAKYDSRATLLVGDDKQLRPPIFPRGQRGDNNFADRLGISLFERLKLAGKESLLLREQFRMEAELSTIPSRVCNSSRLIDGTGTSLADRPRAQLWARFLRDSYDITGVKMFLDVKGSLCEQEPTTMSRYNTDNVFAIVSLLRQAFAYGIQGSEVVVLTPYAAQRQKYRSTFLKLRNATFQAVDVRTIDSFQGGEATYVIVDMVVTAQLGFVGDVNRLNVALTRCRDGLMIVGEIDAARSAERSKTGHYREIINLYRASRASVTIPAASVEIGEGEEEVPAVEEEEPAVEE